MSDNRIRRIVIVGGGTAGWMAAASLAHHFAKTAVSITVVDSSAIGTVGVGEATIPAIRDYIRGLGIDEFELMRATQATVKLGIEFENWSRVGESFMHPFGLFGAPARDVPFHQYWLKLEQQGHRSSFADYSLAAVLAKQNRFTRPHPKPESPLSVFDWALHFDASLFAKFLREYSLKRGVVHLDRRVRGVNLRSTDGFIESLSFDEDDSLAGDLFIDCTGFRALLIEGALQSGYQDWRRWLPCDRALAVPCSSVSPTTPYTRATALEAGWKWRIPLQHRMGNGYVFCSQFLDEEAARERLLGSLEGQALAEPNALRFTTGVRKKIWSKNCIALGLASGFLEPLESTSISMIETGIEKLRRLFPDKDFNPALEHEFNRISHLEFERIRDFLIVHYRFPQREDTEFWRSCRELPLPDALAHKIELFKARGHIVRYEWETFLDPSWLAMYTGFGILPHGYDAAADHFDTHELRSILDGMRRAIAHAASAAPTHEEFIARHCASSNFIAPERRAFVDN
jgi:tryptophan halogenase